MLYLAIIYNIVYIWWNNHNFHIYIFGNMMVAADTEIATHTQHWIAAKLSTKM